MADASSDVGDVTSNADGSVSTLAGNGQAGFNDGVGAALPLTHGTFVVADIGAQRIIVRFRAETLKPHPGL